MKKILLLAAAVLSMVACKDQEEPSIIQPGKQCTLTATIDLDQANQTMARRIKPDLANMTATELNFKWEMGDKVTLSSKDGSETREFEVIYVTSDGKTATLEGAALSDMSSYKVSYGDTDGAIDYAEGTFKPIITGTGVNDAITLDSYCPVLELKLTGNSKISSIQYYVGSALKTTLNFESGLQLSSTAKTVYFPVSAVAENASDAHLDFLGSDNGSSYTIQRQTIPTKLEANTFLTCPELDIHEGLCFTALENNVTISLPSVMSSSDFPSLQYFKTDDDEWTTIEAEGEFEGMNVTLSKGEKLYVKAGDNVTNTKIGYYEYDEYKPLSFSISGETKVSGNIMYLLSSTLATTELTSANAYCFSSLFYNEDLLYSGESGLTDAGDLILPATTLADYCYNSMFKECTSLTKAPELPAKTLASNCYRSMFEKCTSLTKAPELPATTLAESCYSRMFYNCTGLTKAPELPAKTLVKSCYFTMFYGCASLTEAPEISATTVANQCCQSMFNGCSSLTQAPDLKAQTLADNCYYCMFKNCSKLSSVTMLATDVSATSCLSQWLDGAGSSASNKNLYVASGMESTMGSYVPDGWLISEKH